MSSEEQALAQGGDAAEAVIRDAVTDAGVLDVMANNLGLVAAFVAIMYVTAAICAVREVMNSRTSQGSVAWLLSLFFMPYLTVPLYFVFGWRSFSDYEKIQATLGRAERARRADELGLTDHVETRDWPVLSRVAGVPFMAGNKTDLLIDGDATFSAIKEEIAKARNVIFFQFFAIHDDELGREMADALIARAKDGITVYFLYDDVGSHSLSKDYLSRLKAAGVKVCGFNENHKFLRLLGPMRLNYRNHRKLVVVDYRVTFVGGHNVADQYVGRDNWFGHWRDTHVRVEGPAAVACSLSFVEDWLWASGERIDLPQVGEIPMPGDEAVLVMPTGPADKLEECALAFVETAARARKRLWITTPYLVPSLDIQTALCSAAMRGVDVRVLMPEKRDHWTVWLASHAYEDTLVQRGVKVYRYIDGFLHQKVTLMDDELVSIGTVNFDNRSFQINFELTLWFTHPRTISNVERMLETDFQNSRLTWPDAFQSRSYVFRVLAQGARLLSPIL
ncbi:cardiolipin synthase [Roseibium aggregatum]|uniref:Cardiolipin synthase n=1 Tax=Roseibium aggregatum (strain ATCC 25650 / DSM 13394 / JCM 20685 / NBRC 16684 / NCIMB 2208 / IAM 12614 / B1) TaxID=384765 RepID=A0NQF3_ROSAI|nr:cardiolipin synthase [Roseibium aggregatum]EAV45011.1 cardiolipin synthetase [Stappia aggregata IAM 12614] [Roseibium aggregatum IAM 12614]